MARPIPFNRNGLWGLSTQGAPTVTTGGVTFSFDNHPYVGSPYNGLVLINITTAIPTGATTTLPIYFETIGVAGSRRAVTKTGGAPLTVADITGTGYYLFFYDFRTGVVQAISAIV